MKAYAWFTGIVVLVLLAGCATEPEPRAAADSMIELRTMVASARGQIEQTLGALIALMHAPPEQLPDAYRSYAQNVDAMERQAKRIETESKQVDRRGEEWLAAWRESQERIVNPELRQLSQQRQEEVTWRLDNIEDSLSAARDGLAPFVRELQDIRRTVGNDLTSRGLAAVGQTEIVQNATEHGRDVAEVLDEALADLDSVITTFAPARPG